MPDMDHGLERGFGMIVETVIVALLISELVPLPVEQSIPPSGIFWWVIPVSTALLKSHSSNNSCLKQLVAEGCFLTG